MSVLFRRHVDVEAVVVEETRHALLLFTRARDMLSHDPSIGMGKAKLERNVFVVRRS